MKMRRAKYGLDRIKCSLHFQTIFLLLFFVKANFTEISKLNNQKKERNRIEKRRTEHQN